MSPGDSDTVRGIEPPVPSHLVGRPHAGPRRSVSGPVGDRPGPRAVQVGPGLPAGPGPPPSTRSRWGSNRLWRSLAPLLPRSLLGRAQWQGSPTHSLPPSHLALPPSRPHALLPPSLPRSLLPRSLAPTRPPFPPPTPLTPILTTWPTHAMSHAAAALGLRRVHAMPPPLVLGSSAWCLRCEVALGGGGCHAHESGGSRE